MKIKKIRMALLGLSLYLWMALASIAHALSDRGIYLTQNTLENTTYLKYLIKEAKASGINTFVIDIQRPSKRYQQNIALVKESGIKYVARVVIFPGGGTKAQVTNPEFWQKPYRLVKYAMDNGANEIQLDYIRYNTKQRPSSKNAEDILKIIQWYQTRVASQGIPLQVDVFGESSFGESKYIGQNVKLFAQGVNTICPMVYPSHYVPYAWHYKRPYDTVFDSLDSLQDLFGGDKMPVKLIAWIELSNYHYRMSKAQKLAYIADQIEAVIDSKSDGFYAWSPHNRYDNLFQVLQNWNNKKK